MSFQKIPTSLSDVYIIQPQVFEDHRGFFMETYSVQDFSDMDIQTDFIQDNHSRSKKWVLRGLHFQLRKPQAKLVRVTRWAAYTVIVDLRVESFTFWKWEGFLLSEQNKKMLYVPRGFAHGFLTLEDDTEFLYKCDDVYDPSYEVGIMWDDTTLGIDWSRYMDEYGIGEIETSEKDKKNLHWNTYLLAPIF